MPKSKKNIVPTSASTATVGKTQEEIQEAYYKSLPTTVIAGVKMIDAINEKKRKNAENRQRVPSSERAPFYVEDKKFHVRSVINEAGKPQAEIAWNFTDDRLPNSEDIQKKSFEYIPIVFNYNKFNEERSRRREEKKGRKKGKENQEVESGEETAHYFVSQEGGKRIMLCDASGYELFLQNALGAVTYKNKINKSRKTAYGTKNSALDSKYLALISPVQTEKQKKIMNKLIKSVLGGKKKGRVKTNVSPTKQGLKELLYGKKLS